MSTQDATDSTILDLAGRQRMLNQRYCKEVLARLWGVNSSPEATLSLLKRTASALAEGGDTVLIPGTPPVLVRCPGAPTEAIRSILAEQVAAIQQLEAASEMPTPAVAAPGRFGFRKPEPPSSLQSVTKLLHAVEHLHKIADNGVRALGAHFQALREDLEAREKRGNDELRRVFSEVSSQAQRVGAASQELSATSKQLRASAERSFHQAESTLASSKLIFDSVARASEVTHQRHRDDFLDNHRQG